MSFMKTLKALIDLIVAIYKGWPQLSRFIVLVVLVIAGLLAKIESIIININLPLLVIIFLGSLAAYAPLKLIEWTILQTKRPLFQYRDLLWKPLLFSFQEPTPICPHNNCGLKISCRTEQDISFRPSQMPGVFQASPNYIYIYECPQHNEIFRSHEGLTSLRANAKQVYNKSKNEKSKP